MMKRFILIPIGVLSSVALAACATVDPAVERGVEERPDEPPQVTLPPVAVPSPTPIPAPIAIPTANIPAPTPTAVVPTPTPDALSSLVSGAPWLLYCGAEEKAALMAPDGPGRHVMDLECLPPRMLAATTGFAMVNNRLIQLPTGETGRAVCCLPVGWSVDGNRALYFNDGLIAEQTELQVYDVPTSRSRQVYVSSFQVEPLGLSPSGDWVVFLESEQDFDRAPTLQPPAELMAISFDGRQERSLYDVYDADTVLNSIAGWISESNLLVTRSEPLCNLEPRHLELLNVNMNAGTARHLFALHSQFAVDPVTQTVLLEELPPEACSDEPQRGRLVTLSADDGWVPHPVSLPDEWGDDLDIGQIEWHPELGRFSARIVNQRQPATLRLVTLDLEGIVDLVFPLGEGQVTSNARLFPSPDGDWIVVGASPPHGTALYNDAGELVRELEMPSGELSYGVQHGLWMPDISAFYMSAPETRGIYQAAAADGWEPRLIEPQTDYGTWLTLVNQPKRPYRSACGGGQTTRLYTGDQVVVSEDPPLASRVRDRPGIDGTVIGMLEPGQRAVIVDGPTCGDRYVWWHLQPEGSAEEGWVAQGNPYTSWLLPVD